MSNEAAGLIDAPVVDPRCGRLDRSCSRGHRARTGVNVAAHQPVALLVDLVTRRLDHRGYLDLQGLGKHMPGTRTHDLVPPRGHWSVPASADRQE